MIRRRTVAGMDKTVRSIISVVAHRLRSRSAVELENLALGLISGRFFAASARVDPACSRSIGCFGFGSTEYGCAILTAMVGQPRYRRSVASSRLSPILD